ncbi:MAG: hypothetical protein Q9196_004284 [Gyalolechia fulgens]
MALDSITTTVPTIRGIIGSDSPHISGSWTDIVHALGTLENAKYLYYAAVHTTTCIDFSGHISHVAAEPPTRGITESEALMDHALRIALWWLAPSALLFFTLSLLRRLLRIQRYPDEPPYIDPKFPFIGHVLGVLQSKYGYYVDLFLVFPGMPTGRVYIINSSDLAASVQRYPLQLSFWKVEATFSGLLVGLSTFAAKTLAENIESDNRHGSYLRDGVSNVHATLKPGKKLTDTTRAALKALTPAIKDLDGTVSGEVELQHVITEAMMTSVTSAVFGPQNPYRDSDVARCFWLFQENAAGLLSLPFPSITCAKAYTAREKITAAFLQYDQGRGNDSASHWVQGATRVSDNYQISDQDKARLDISNSHAVLSNTIPTAFWTVYHIFSSPALLEEVRAALMPLVKIEMGCNGAPTYYLDTNRIRDLPIMRSVVYEALRHYANGTGTRIVTEDIMLNNRYLLKKGAFVFMPNRSYHFNPAVWGPDVDDFDARRFMRTSFPSTAFRAFGGGVNQCPGRFFAMNTILVLSAVLALRFDVESVAGTWTHPGVDDRNMTLTVQPPKAKVRVRFIPREGWTDGHWKCTT